ncbi:helix-turn-helix domain-containing protein [Collinsella sp. AGMB00827]|uniref:Helix-turn-helix domain-containing protein n=1 Tax=Collinsella ureilytica TaxID=2869515 RepID=A0ABS7MKZ7_9ACTN|nr:helix-turn-helix domain-containing protein [Collinsella urealyticum]MBY4797983.1 helix-turn-helix domain-containing protein [Collinsella urealyticum]
MSESFGEMLLNRRRQLGLSIQQVANTIKMRPQIIEYFETDNFDAMPQRGYAQGMIASYARFLGLNPRTVVDAYFDGLYRYQHSPGASTPANFTGAMDASPRSANAGGRYLMVDTRSAGSRFAQRPPQAGYVPDSRFARDEVDERLSESEFVDRDRALTRRSPVAQSHMGSRLRSGTRGRSRGDFADRRPCSGPRAGRRPRSQRSRQTMGHRDFDIAALLSDGRVALGLLGVIAVLIILLVLLLVRGCTGARPVSAGSEPAIVAPTKSAGSTAQTTKKTSTSPETPAPAPQALPTEYQVKIVYTGKATAWVEIEIDGAYAKETGTITKGFSQTYTVKDSMTVSTDSTADVEVYRDGEKLRYDTKSSGVGKITIEVPKPPAEAQGESKDAHTSDTTDASQSDEGTAE